MKRRSFFARIFGSLLAPVAATAATTRRIDFPGTLTCDHPMALGVEVVDLDNGKTLQFVKAVNVREGWVECYKCDRSGRIKCAAGGGVARWEKRDGRVFPVYRSGWDVPLLERKTGNYEVRRKVSYA